MIEQDKIPLNSIGFCKVSEGWAYWYWDGHTFDSGVERTQELAFKAAKQNHI